MNSNKFWAAVRKALPAVTVTLFVILLLVPGAGAQTYKVLYKFKGSPNDGYGPSGLVFDTAGNLYGTTVGGGLSNGTVFKLSPNGDGTWTESVIYSFQWSDGVYPLADLIFDDAGNLYGTTIQGGADSDCGLPIDSER
jgi:uncharacterized repeat protein (TIGR03803 family)